MKRSKWMAFVLLCALCVGLLGGCGAENADPTADPADPYAGLTHYEHPVGVSLYMEDGYTESEIEGILGGYQGASSGVRLERETFAALQTVNYDGASMSETDYAALIAQAYELDAAPKTDGNGNVFLPYTRTVEGSDVSYYAYFIKTADSFWTVTFFCLSEEAETMAPGFALWADSVVITAEPVPTPEPTPEAPQPEELTQEEMEDLIELVEKTAPVDYLGRSFVTAELENDEMLRLSYAVFGAQQYGIVGIEGSYFRDGIAKKFFGYEMELGDMVCSCGELLTPYDAAADHYSWEGHFHDYIGHQAQAYNQYQQAYRLEDRYYVTMYKIFPDLTEQSDPSAMNFYATYEDAKNQANILFTAGTEDEFTAQLEALDDSRKVLYTCVFERDEEDRLILVEYQIGA